MIKTEEKELLSLLIYLVLKYFGVIWYNLMFNRKQFTVGKGYIKINFTESWYKTLIVNLSWQNISFTFSMKKKTIWLLIWQLSVHNVKLQ